MKKIEKQQAEEFLDLMEQAHSEIRNSLEKKDVSTALTLLADCQDGAISLGNLIEAAEGEGFVTVPLLEEYCELAYQLHESLAGGESIEAGKAYKLLRNQVIKIRNSVRNDIKVRKEVVFLPYKASMWDSLESVWKAACEDPDCDAYVIPVPYYDKNPDGSFREMHYEGNLYPKDVPVTWYKDYDFAEHRPDMIYIHNPYDECNYVTSVHPDFYSGKLKQYTDNLVYIPYFILAEPESDNADELKGMAHFCTVPGVINADKIIVQSEEMRKAYISILAKAYGENTRSHWAKKILGIGSPKVDKVLNIRKEDLEIPVEWLKIIQKPDGSWKKIILYNTGVSALLEHGEKMLVKIQDVLRVFKENQDEVVLLWRPHPLIQATVESMRPWLWAEYRKLREQYRAEGWGIYDDSADLDRAIAVSDAYYGDPSSVVQLYEKIGKKYIYQNADITTKQSKKGMNVADYAHTEGGLLFKSRYIPGTYMYNYSIKKTLLLEEAEKNIDNNIYAYYTALSYKQYVIFPPYISSKFVIWNEENNSFIYIDKKVQGYYYSGCTWNDQCYLFTDDLNEVTIIKENKGSLNCMYPREQEIKKGKHIKIHQRIGVACQYNEKVYFASFEEDTIVEYDLNLNTVNMIAVKTENMIINTIYFDGDNFWISGNKAVVYRTSKDFSSVVDKITLPEKYFQEWPLPWKSCFSTGVVVDEYIFYAPLYYRALIRIHRTTLEVNTVYLMEDNQYSWGISKFDQDKLFLDLMENEKGQGNVILDSAGNVLESDVFDCEEVVLDTLEYNKNALMYLMKNANSNSSRATMPGNKDDNVGKQIFMRLGGAQ